MANTTLSPNMNLPIPVQGTDPGPDYALNINSCLMFLDQHTHASGSGVRITPAAIDINSDFSMNSNVISSIYSTKYIIQPAVLDPVGNLTSVYVTGVDLYYNDLNGNQIQITSGGGVAGSPGSIANLTSPASASYVSASKTFVWQSDVNKPAYLDAASIILRNLSTNSKGLTLNPPAAMGADYALTLPALPPSQYFMTVDNTGAMVGYASVTSGIVTANIADGSVTTAKLADGAVTTVKIGTAAVDTNNIAGNAVTNAKIAIGSVDTSQLFDNAITTIKITDANVTAAKLASNAVTTAKIADGAVTGPKLGTPVTSSTATITGTTASTSFVTVGATALITRTGRPVLVIIQPTPSSSAVSSLTGSMEIAMLRNGTIIAIFSIITGDVSFSFIDYTSGVTGSSSYTIQYRSLGGTVSITNAQLLVLEV